VFKEATGVLGGDRRKRLTDRLDQGFFRPGFGFAHKPLDLREGFFYGVEIRRVGRQVDELAASLFDQLAYPFAFVGFKRLSITTTWPLRSVGARTCST
jgi:hypothetical protein